jgi:hypothetical protein
MGCNHDERYDTDCQECREAIKQSALDAGIPLAVFEGKAKLSDYSNEECQGCERQECQTCCPHDDRDHGICLDCEHEEDPGAAADWYRDQMEDR